MTYNIGKKTLSANVGIGYIVQCNYNDDFGIVYGNRMDNNGTTLTNNCYINLLWFKKKRETVYKPFTIVSYLQETFNNPTFKIFQIVVFYNIFQVGKLINLMQIILLLPVTVQL